MCSPVGLGLRADPIWVPFRANAFGIYLAKRAVVVLGFRLAWQDFLQELDRLATGVSMEWPMTHHVALFR